ncbi:MAG: lysophospholipid acyltransferase family protein [Desulfosoma sp.]
MRRDALSPDNPLLRPLPSWGASVLCALHQTCRFRVLGHPHLQAVLDGPRPGLLAIWHFAFPSVISYFRHLNAVIMVSRSRDGEWAARLVHALGFQTVRGSSHRGGAEALRAMFRLVRKGYPAGLVADGSQGPALVAQKGIVWLAAAAQLPLVPLSLAADRAWRLPSWDRTLIPKPFSRIIFAAGEPIHVPRPCAEDDLELHRGVLETRLNALTELARKSLAQPASAHGWIRGGGWVETFRGAKTR